MAEWLGVVGDVPNTQRFGAVLPVILGYLLRYACHQEAAQCGVCVGNWQLVSLCLTIALVAESASMPLPSCNFSKIVILCLTLVGASLLSSSVPPKLAWVPYFSCVRPLFHFLPQAFRHRILQHFEKVWDDIKRLATVYTYKLLDLFRRLHILQVFQSGWNVIRRQSVTDDDASPDASKANFISEGLDIGREEVSLDVHPGIQRSSPISLLEELDTTENW